MIFARQQTLFIGLLLAFLFMNASAFAQSAVNGSYVGDIKLSKIQKVVKSSNTKVTCSAPKIPFTVGYIVYQTGSAVEVYNSSYTLIYRGKASSTGFSGKGANKSEIKVSLLEGSKARITVTRQLSLPRGNACRFSYTGVLDFFQGFEFIPI